MQLNLIKTKSSFYSSEFDILDESGKSIYTAKTLHSMNAVIQALEVHYSDE